MIVAPSILSIDFLKFKEQLELVNQSQATWIHFDVMDGHFVDNLTFGPDVLKAVKRASDLFLDVHIMVIEPESFVDMFVNAGAHQITFHLEATQDIERTKKLIRLIQSKGCKAGISIKPDTLVEAIDPFIEMVDLVLIMSVYPGFGGQSFIEDSLSRIAYVKNKIIQGNLNALIQVDGGINNTTIEKVKQAGVDVVVAGSYVFKNDIKKAIESLC
jgi:ribulose-phosphate 3-epimerase